MYDIKNLKLKLRPNEEHQYNSPWNIAADFDIDMSLSAKQIAVMLDEYEADHQTGMNIVAIAEEIYQYTSGYPYLVSAICKIMDEKLPRNEIFAELAEYLNYFHQEKGYMISFNFNKKKEIGVRELRVEGKTIIEAVV